MPSLRAEREHQTADAARVLAECYALLRAIAKRNATTGQVVASEEGARAGARSVSAATTGVAADRNDQGAEGVLEWSA